MQGSRIHYIVGGLLLVTVCSDAIAIGEPLQPDPAWQQKKLDNGFSWQLLSTPQRPSDRIELRLVVETGSLVETAQQTGFAHLLPRLALTRSESFTTPELTSLWQQSMDREHPLPPAITSYDFTTYNLSLPSNRPDLLKQAITWLADTAGNLALDDATLKTALQSSVDPVATFPMDSQDPWWRYRLKGSTLLAHSPSDPVNPSVDVTALKSFYQQWYTPDAMTLYVVGKVDMRSVDEQINKAFSGLTRKRQTPAPLPAISPLPKEGVTLFSDQNHQDMVSLVWDNIWTPIKDAQALTHYWRSDLAREALYWHLQQALEKSAESKEMKIGFSCRVQYQRSLCSINLITNQQQMEKGAKFLTQSLADLRNQGLSQAQFDALIGQKTEQLNQLFVTYARMDTDVLISQRLRSQESGVVDIAPEQYQKLRQNFLSTLTLAEINQELKQQLAQDPVWIVQQKKGEPEVNVKALEENYDKVMSLIAPATPVSSSGKTDSTPATEEVQAKQ